jgi:hypothetical protein
MLVRATSSGQFSFFTNISSTSFVQAHTMASPRPGTRRDGSTYVQVLYRLDGKQSQYQPTKFALVQLRANRRY